MHAQQGGLAVGQVAMGADRLWAEEADRVVVADCAHARLGQAVGLFDGVAQGRCLRCLPGPLRYVRIKDSLCAKGVRPVRVLRGFLVAPGMQQSGWALPCEGPDLGGNAPDSGMSGSEQAGAAGWVARVR